MILAAVRSTACCAPQGLLAGLSYRDRTRWGIERREARRRFEAAMDGTERSALVAARTLPLVLGIIAGVVGGDGFSVRVAAAAVLVAFLVAQIAFALWFSARRSE
jgi:hypothetical protein